MSRSSEITAQRPSNFNNIHSAEADSSGATFSNAEANFINPTSYLEKLGFDQSGYRRTALNVKFAQARHSATGGGQIPKPPVSHRFKANAGTYGSRGGTDIDAIILHHTAGSTASGAASALNSRGLSVHYVVDKDGTIYQMVGDEKRAFHAGHGSGKWTNANSRSIGIEIVNLGNGQDKYTEAQYRALEKLVPYLAQKYRVPLGNIVGHSQIGNPDRPAGSPEPSRNFDWQRIRQSVRNDAPPAPNPPAPQPDKPDKITAPTAFLRRGNHGGQVKKLQDALVKLRYMTRGEIGNGYGVFGPRTERALKTFQREHQDGNGRPLAADGIYGSLTRGAMRRALQRGGDHPSKVFAPSAFLHRGDHNNQVKKLQDALVKLHYMKRSEIGGGYGMFGPKTERALKAFQRDRRDASGRPLAADGIYGPKTRRAMQKALHQGNANPNPSPNPPSGGGRVKIDDIAGVKNNPNVTPAFKREVSLMAKRLGTKPEYLMAVMSFESGLSPRAVNPTSGATGLIQFLPSTARNLGTNTAALRNMSSVEQLKYVEKYFQPFKGKLKTLEATYTAVLSGSPHQNANDVLFRRGTPAYNGNKGLDFNRNGQITAGEATSAVAAKMFGGTQRVQQKLKNLGFDPKGVDGVFGPNTSKAVAAFQRSRKLPATRLLNERTGLTLINAKPRRGINGGRALSYRRWEVYSTGDAAARHADGFEDLQPHHGPAGQWANYVSRSVSLNHNLLKRDIVLTRPGQSNFGQAVPSPLKGKVLFAGNENDGYGNKVVVKNESTGQVMMIGHLNSISVRRGQSVVYGQRLGGQGSTGNSTGAHVHINADPSVIKRWVADLADGKFDGVRRRFNVGRHP